MSTIVKYYQNRQICLSKVHKMTHEVWNKCISSKSQQFCNIVDRVVLPQLHCCKNFDPSMLHLQVQLHLHISEKCIFASNTLFTSFKSKIKVGFGPNKPQKTSKNQFCLQRVTSGSGFSANGIKFRVADGLMQVRKIRRTRGSESSSN